MSSDVLWLALGLVLVLEGLYPFVSPQGWRKLFAQLLQLKDEQVRGTGLVCILVGLVLIWAFGR
ncbi:MAG: DUF2065 family protein [Rhodoferax sp.]|nr:MAG: DUF2065 family protein [Rhodoferax sp.]